MQALDLDAEKRERDRQELKEGLEMLDRKKEQLARDKQIEKRQLRKMLDEEVWPFGRPGAGAPNADTVRKRKVFLGALPAIVGPQDLPIANKGLQLTHVTTMGRPGAGAPVRSKSGKIKVLRVEDPQLRFQFHAPIRNMVDNELRYKQPYEDKAAYKKELDQLIEQRKRIKSDQRRHHEIQDCKLGWTDPKILERMQESMPKLQQLQHDRPQADYGHPSFESNNKEPFSLPMLPLDRHFLPPSKEPKTWVVYVIKNPRVSRIPVPIPSPLSSGFDSTTTLTTPLPPAHANARPPQMPQILQIPQMVQMPPRPRPTTHLRADPIKEPIWRDTAPEKEYHEALQHQIEEQQQRRQEERNQDLNNSRKHFENWQNFWGRPGHGAPRSVKVKENLDYLLYHLPLITSKNTNMIK